MARLLDDDGIMLRLLLASVMAIGLAACSHEAAKRYPMQGQVKALDPTSKTATIDAGKIGDWMEAMTMEYRVKPDAEYAKLHVGDRIEATVVVLGGSWYVTDVKVVPKQ
jgi:Cu/Ag efflux protein CusF